MVALIAAGIVIRYGFAVNRLARGIGQTMFYGADGQPWFPLEEHRRDVPLTRISAYLRDAVVAVEDHRFHSHLGIDPIAVGRAVIRDVRAGGLEEGGSTLTQQLARTLFLTASRGDWTRKGKEAVLALMIEQRLSKPQILELYLNRIYLGGNVYGVEAMSQNVFGKCAADLTLPEARLSRGSSGCRRRSGPGRITTAPSQRSHVVLARMREEGLITAQAEQQARAAPPRILADPGLNRGAAGYAQDYLRQQFKAEFEDDNPPDWKVRTTFVPGSAARGRARCYAGTREIPAVRTASRARRDRSARRATCLLSSAGATSGARRSTAQLERNASRVLPSNRFVYAAALEGGMSPISPVSNLNDLRVPGYDEWEIKNASLDTRDTLTLREALYESNNQAAVKLQTQVGSRPVLRMAELLGMPEDARRAVARPRRRRSRRRCS